MRLMYWRYEQLKLWSAISRLRTLCGYAVGTVLKPVLRIYTREIDLRAYERRSLIHLDFFFR